MTNEEERFLRSPYRYITEQRFVEAYQNAIKTVEADGLKSVEVFAESVAGIVDCLFESLTRVADQRDLMEGSVSAEMRSLKARVARLIENSSANPKVRQRVFNMTEGQCFYCAAQLVMSGAEFLHNDERQVLHVDHIVPKAAGGPDHVSNYVPSCGPCNQSKGDSPYIEFVRYRHPRLRIVVNS